MKVEVSVKPNIPSESEVFKMKDAIVQTVTMWMRWLGITKVNAEYPFPEHSGMTRLTWKPIEGMEPPTGLQALRPFMLVNVIQILMERFNIISIEIGLDSKETEELSNYWAYLVETGAKEGTDMVLIG